MNRDRTEAWNFMVGKTKEWHYCGAFVADIQVFEVCVFQNYNYETIDEMNFCKENNY